MKELSFLMFLIAISAILLTICNKIFRLDQNKTISIFPSKAKFNLAWGFIFYTTYGLIIAKTFWLKAGFVCIIIILAAYLLYLYLLLNFLYEKPVFFRDLIRKILLWKFSRQQQKDKIYKLDSYNLEQTLHILGLPPFPADQSGLIIKRTKELKALTEEQDFKKNYLIEIIKKLDNNS